jgi:hypothetical protein
MAVCDRPGRSETVRIEQPLGEDSIAKMKETAEGFLRMKGIDTHASRGSIGGLEGFGMKTPSTGSQTCTSVVKSLERSATLLRL